MPQEAVSFLAQQLLQDAQPVKAVAVHARAAQRANSLSVFMVRGFELPARALLRRAKPCLKGSEDFQKVHAREISRRVPSHLSF